MPGSPLVEPSVEARVARHRRTERFGEDDSDQAPPRRAFSTRDPRINAARVAVRFIEGGHAVPIDKIVSRYEKAMVNLAAAIKLADRVYLYDNSVEDAEARLAARTESGELRKVYVDLPAWIEAAVGTLVRHPDLVDLRAG